VNPLTSTLSTPAYDVYYTAARNCAPTQGRQPKSLERGELGRQLLLYSWEFIGGGDDELLGKGPLPEIRLADPPLPLSLRRVFVYLDKFFSADTLYYDFEHL